MAIHRFTKTGKVEVVMAGGDCFKLAVVGGGRSSEKPHKMKTGWNAGFG